MTVSSKVRLYDLAKELKLDTKRLIEEVRREGVDVSVPSNSVSKELAEKIRNKYFPKKETAVKRAVKVVKRASMPATETPAAVEPEPEATELPEVEAAPVEIPVEPTPVVEEPDVPRQPSPARLVKKLTPAARAEQPAEVAVEEIAPVEEPEIEVEAPEAPPVEEEAPVVSDNGEVRRAPAPPSRQVRVLRPTAAALNAGIKHGERAPAPTPPPPVAPRERVERAGSGRVRERPSLPRSE